METSKVWKRGMYGNKEGMETSKVWKQVRYGNEEGMETSRKGCKVQHRLSFRRNVPNIFYQYIYRALMGGAHGEYIYGGICNLAR